ncbi:MAG: hypothetical protein ACYSWO_16025 [Planctomycetota bacterium]
MPRACSISTILLSIVFHLGAIMAAGSTASGIRDATSTFEVGAQIRAWTIRDEGMDYILDNMQSMCGVNNVYMVVVMHQEHRPFHAPEFPHNPARDAWEAEDSRVTFFPDMKRYGVIKPRVSDIDWIRETDWLRLMVKACRARGMKTGAEVSHFPIPKELIRANPDWQQRKINGEPVSSRFCPNNPVTREYVLALFGDLAANYDLDYIQTCQYLFNNKDIDEGGTCFCDHCIAAAKRSGFDLKAAVGVLQTDKNAQPDRKSWLAFRRRSSTEFYRLISEKIRQENPECHLRYNDTHSYGRHDPRDYGLCLDEAVPHLGSLVNQDHEEQKGNANETFEWRRKWLERNRTYVGPDMPLLCGIGARMKATPELIKRGIKAALESSARIDGLVLKHYDGASFSHMRAFKQGMIEQGVQGLTPTIGKEVEEMELDGYARMDGEFVEEWGVETQETGTASYSFDNTSGAYDVKITYFDENDGQGRVTLFVAGTKSASFKLDEDVDCWRWRLFKNIHVDHGDEIKLVGRADGTERVRLDFIEFIPSRRHSDTP